MTVSATYLVLQQTIADELGDRQDLLSVLADSSLTLSPIKNAIQSAISKWEREPFYFNSAYTTSAFSTVAQQEVYTTSDAAAIATMAEIDQVRLTNGNNRWTLNPRTWAYLNELSVSSTSYGMPIDWAYIAEQIRFYPIPDAAYAMTLVGTKRLTNLSADADTNVWTQDGYDLIRSEAKLILAREVLFDDALAARMEAAIYGPKGYLAALKGETSRREARGRIRPTAF